MTDGILKIGDGGTSSQHKHEQVTYKIRAAEVEDGGDGFFGSMTHQLYYGGTKYFKDGTIWTEAAQVLRKKAAEGYPTKVLKSAYYRIIAEGDVINELEKQGKLNEKKEGPEKEKFIDKEVESFGNSFLQPRIYNEDLSIVISKACGFEISFNGIPGLMVLEEEKNPNHIAFLVRSWNKDFSYYQYYSVLSVVRTTLK